MKILYYIILDYVAAPTSTNKNLHKASSYPFEQN